MTNHKPLAHVIVTDAAINRARTAPPGDHIVYASPQLAADHYTHAARQLRLRFGVTNRAADYLDRLAIDLRLWLKDHPTDHPAVADTP